MVQEVEAILEIMELEAQHHPLTEKAEMLVEEVDNLVLLYLGCQQQV
jgi:hypothetical protein